MPHEWSILNGNLIVDNSAALMDGSGGYHGPVRWTYVHMADGVIVDPHVGFYRNPPPNAKCRWSTNNGERNPRHFDKNLLKMPSRELWLWDDAKLKTVADVYKQRFWSDLKSLTRPNTFLDLYEYFDSATLWYAGAYNLWNLINMLVTEAHQRWPAVLDHWKKEIDEWVHGLLFEWDGFEHNQNALRRWDGRSDPLVDVQFNHMFNVGFDVLGPQETSMLRDALINSFYHMTGQVPYLPPPTYPYHPRPFENVNTSPVKLATASSKAVVIASSDVPKRPSSKSPSPKTEHNDVKMEQPSPPASLSSIPEEAGAENEPHIPTEKLKTTKDVTTVPAPVQADKNMRDRKDSNGSTDALFFSSSPARLEVSGRQLSTRSAPDEKCESMLSTAAHGSQRDTSTPTTKSSSTSRGKAKHGPWRLQHKSPPRNNSCPPYRPTEATPPQNPHNAHMPPVVPPNHMPQHPSMMMPGPSGMLPHQNGFAPFVPPRPLGAGMGPTMPFHSQLPVERAPMGLAPVQVGFPNNSPQFQQPGAHNYQPRPNTNTTSTSTNNNNPPGHAVVRKPGNRRDSTVSNGSRKVRDDPVHGAIYSLHEPGPRKNSSSSRRPSFANVQCNNGHLRSQALDHILHQTFRECACPNCDQATRSVHVKFFAPNLQPQQKKEALMAYFGYLNPVVALPKKSSHAALVMFRDDKDAMRAVINFQNNPDKSIQGLTTSADVWFPIFSKHYCPRGSIDHRPFVEARNDRNSPSRSSQSKVREGSWRNAPPCPGEEPLMNLQPLPGSNIVPFVPIPVPPPQRTLWEPTATPARREKTATPRKGSMEPTFPSQAEKRDAQPPLETLGKAGDGAEERCVKEDWRSKPPSEEAIADDGEDEAAPVDTVSNHSSQSSRSIKVCLPSPQKTKAGEELQGAVAAVSEVQPDLQLGESLASSRTMSPQVCDDGKTTPSTIIGASSPAPAEAALTEKADVSTKDVSESQTQSKACEKHQQKKVNNKHTLAVENPAPTTNLPEPSDDVAHGASGRGYRKTQNDLFSAVTMLWPPNDTGTIIRHKPQTRTPVPSSWTAETPEAETEPGPQPEPEPEPAATSSNSRVASAATVSGRFREIRRLVEQEQKASALIKMVDAALAHGSGPEKQVTDPVEEPQQPPKKKAKHKKEERKAQGGSGSGSGSTPADAPARGPSPSSTSQHTVMAGPPSSSSRGPSPAMQSHDDIAAPPPARSGTQKSTKRRKNGRYNKQRQGTHAASEPSEGSAKSEGSQGRQDQGIPPPGSSQTEEAKIEQPTETTMVSEAPESKAPPQGKPADAKPTHKSNNNKEGYRANNGGSLRMKKNRSPEKAKMKEAAAPQERDVPSTRDAAWTLPAIFEPPKDEPKNTSPGAGLFRDQKSVIDELKRQGGPVPTPSGGSETHLGDGTCRSWSGVVKNEDPLSAATGKATITATKTTKERINDNTAARPPREEGNKGRANDSSSPTPSPEKKKTTTMTTHKHTKSKTMLSATAPLFVSSRPTSPVPLKTTKLNPSVQPFANAQQQPQPPSPAESVVVLDQNKGTGSGTTAVVKTAGAEQPSNTAAIVPSSSAPSNVDKKKENVPHHHHHAKKPSLPGHSAEVDKRFVTPADQVSDPTKLTQPGAPAREKKKATAPTKTTTATSTIAGGGGGPHHGTNPNHIPVHNPRWIPLAQVEAEENPNPAAAPPPRTAAEAAAVPKVDDVPTTITHTTTTPNQRDPAAATAKDKKSKGTTGHGPGTTHKKKSETAAAKKTAAEVASSETNALAPAMSSDNFPTLGEAAVATGTATGTGAALEGKKKRAVSVIVVKSGASSSSAAAPAGAPAGGGAGAGAGAGGSATGTSSQPSAATTTTAGDKKTSATSSSIPAATTTAATPPHADGGKPNYNTAPFPVPLPLPVPTAPRNNTHSAPTTSSDEPTHKNKKQADEEDKDGWRVVSSNKKTSSSWSSSTTAGGAAAGGGGGGVGGRNNYPGGRGGGWRGGPRLVSSRTGGAGGGFVGRSSSTSTCSDGRKGG